MKHYHIVTCPFCNCDDLVKNGHSENKTQRWLCNGCKKSFQLEYTYNAYNPGVKEKIVELTLNSSGVRDISRTLKINKNTVMSEFKKKEPAKVNPYLLDLEEINKLNKLDIVFHYTAEMDEFWSFVENKSNQRWTWYAMEKHTGIIISWHNGKRTDEDFKILLKQMENIPVNKYYTDDWGAYSRLLPKEKHVIGKDKTWKIERKNLNFRTHLKRLNRKTICFSKNEIIHDNVIGMYIERFYYKTGTYGNN